MSKRSPEAARRAWRQSVACALHLAPSLALAFLLGGCAIGATSENDPWEGMNRKVFWFNEQLDEYALEPVARGWDTITSPRVQRSVDDFFTNLAAPVHLVNNLAQGKLIDSGVEIGRFVVNTTVGLLGFFDPATDWGMPDRPEDFGQTLATWGVPSGPYLVLPVFGPSNPCDAVGLVGDVTVYNTVWDVDGEVLLASRVVDVVNTRSLLLQPLREAKQASLDYYVFVRNAYMQRRRVAIEGPIEKRPAESQQAATDFYDEDLATEPDDAPQP